MEFAWLLAKGYGSDAQITSLLKKERVVIVPVINADGFVASRGTAEDGFIPDPYDSTGVPEGDTVEGVAVPFGGNLAYRRKNCDGPVPSLGGAERDYPCYYQWGVDPNRNYGEGWGGPGASPDPNTQVYRGDDQWSEPETQAVHEYSQTHPGDGDHLAAQRRRAGAAPAGPAHGRQGARRGHAQGSWATRWRTPPATRRSTASSSTTPRARPRTGTTPRQGSLGYTIEIGPEDGQFHMAVRDRRRRAVARPALQPGRRDQPAQGRHAPRAAGRPRRQPPTRPSTRSSRARLPPAACCVCRSRSRRSRARSARSRRATSARARSRRPTASLPGAQRSQVDKLEYTTVVGKDGRYSWHVTPSTRPFVGSRNVAGEATSRVTTFTGDGQGSAPAQGETKEYGFDVPASDYTRNLDIKLSWTAAPEDYDLYLYYVKPDGERVPIGEGQAVDGVLIYTDPGAGQNPNGLPEHIIVTAPPAGHYVAAVVNNQGVLNDYTLTATATGEKPGHVESTGVTEPFDLTCELPDGTKRTTRHGVVVSRGGRSRDSGSAPVCDLAQRACVSSARAAPARCR